MSDQQAFGPSSSEQTLIRADAGYHGEDNLRALYERAIPALMA